MTFRCCKPSWQSLARYNFTFPWGLPVSDCRLCCIGRDRQWVDRSIDTPRGRLAGRNIDRKIAYGLAITRAAATVWFLLLLYPFSLGLQTRVYIFQMVACMVLTTAPFQGFFNRWFWYFFLTYAYHGTSPAFLFYTELLLSTVRIRLLWRIQIKLIIIKLKSPMNRHAGFKKFFNGNMYILYVQE